MKGGFKKKIMKFNFRKISAIASSALMVGMTLGVAAAANYPAPFVTGGAADVAIVFGTGDGVSFLDQVQSAYISTDLQSKMSTGLGGTAASTTGETVSLGTSADKIWLNTSLNTVKTQLTKSDLPTTLADYTFSGNVESKLTYTIKTVAGAAAGGTNSGKVIFASQPTSSNDPVIGVSIGSSQSSYPLYNATATMSAINFTHADSEGEEIELFGQKFTIASATDTTDLVLLKEAEKVSLDSDNPSATVVIGGATYTIELLSASDTQAEVRVTDSSGVSASKEISEAASKKVNGVTIAVQTASETNFKLSASIIVGAEKITLTHGSVVTTGDSQDPVLGTYAYLTGGTTATTEIAISVFYPDSESDAILPGESFVDPLFGSFKVDFAGLSSPLDDAERDVIEFTPSGTDDIQLKFIDQGGNEKTFGLVHNASGATYLGDSSGYTYGIAEMANLSYGASGKKYVVVGNEDYGHLLELYDVYNQTTGTNAISNDRVKFRDVFSGDVYESSFVSTEGSGTIDVDGKRYTVTFGNTGESGWVQLKYPTTDSAAAKYVLFPTIETQRGALVTLYEPLLIDLSNHDGAGTDVAGFEIPDGDGYTAAAVTYLGGTNWSIGTGAGIDTLQALNYSAVTVGKLTYNFTGTGTANSTRVYVINPESAGSNINGTAVIVTEGKGDTSSNDYHAMVVSVETTSGGTSTNELGLNDITFSSPTHWEVTQQTDSDITEHLDFYGTHVLWDVSVASQAKAKIMVPKNNVFADLYIGEDTSVVTGGTTGTSGTTTPLGEILVKDAEVGQVSTKNLIVIGGSCINSAAATLVGGAYCGTAWTEATGVGSGQFLIKGYATNTLAPTKLALLVAGFNAADTVNAGKYLRTKVVDTSKFYIGTSATNADLQVETA